MRVNPIIGMNMSKGKWSRKPPQPVKPLDPDIARECLKCRKPFNSEGIHNRLCTTCKSNHNYSMIV